MRVLVTGGAGFIGSHIADALIEAGHDVSIVDDLSMGVREYVNPAAKFYQVDIRSKELADVFAEAKPEIVNHQAAQMNVTLSLNEPVFDTEVNVVGTVNILQNCVDHDVRKIVFASSGGTIYGDPEKLPADEDTPPQPVSQYGTGKLAGEQYIALYNRLYDLDYTILRYSNVYGPRQLPHGEACVCAILANLMFAGKTPTLFGHGEPLRDYVYVGDVVRANVAAIKKASGCMMNIARGQQTSVLELFHIMRDLIEFEGEPILKPLRAGEVKDIYISCDRAKELLGWEPKVDLRDGLATTVEFFREQQTVA